MDDEYELDNEERYGELQEYSDNETGERYTINPFTGAKNYKEYDEILVCDICGQEVGTKLIGDEVYDWCEEDGCVEANTYTELVEV